MINFFDGLLFIRDKIIWNEFVLVNLLKFFYWYSMKLVRSKSIEVDFVINWKRFKVVVDNEDNDVFDYKMDDGIN